MDCNEGLPDLCIENVTNDVQTPNTQNINGRRIVDLVSFLESLKSLKHNGFGCSFYNMNLVAEKRLGFKSLLTFECNMCNKIETVSTESELNKDVNKSVVCGSIAIGIGHTQLSELCASINIPPISSTTYVRHQNEVQEKISSTLWKELLEAGEEDRKLALEAGDVDSDGIPFTTVIVDGAWAKRSYKTNYNALSGVACIIGYRTKKILYVAVKNKYCCVCEKHKSNRDETPNHHCFKNWTGPSTAMESGVILEGFQCSVRMHNLKYLRLIGDGDSSVYKKIQDSKPYGPDSFVEKIECRNHILRNFCQRVKDLSKRPKLSVEIKQCLKNNILRFRSAVVGAVKYRKNENVPFVQKIKQLKSDILNGPTHIFGNHDNCKDQAGNNKYFCKGPKSGECDLYEFFKNTSVFSEFQCILRRVVDNSASLLHDVDNNKAENYNSIVNKMVGGKRVNFSLRGSYETRCKAAAIAFNNQGSFVDIVQESISEGEVGEYTKYFSQKIRRQKKENRRKVTTKKKLTVCEADSDYGAIAEDIPDKNEYKLAIEKNKFLMALKNIDHKKKVEDAIGQILTLSGKSNEEIELQLVILD